ncbi:hypothetical protein QE152_g31431 [Popillia japonica]|uniref:Uncharacterized protein n=1 Tax=Popillia japonica TaxID=7064 RepID=A0AAW1J180_POPJA
MGIGFCVVRAKPVVTMGIGFCVVRSGMEGFAGVVLIRDGTIATDFGPDRSRKTGCTMGIGFCVVRSGMEGFAGVFGSRWDAVAGITRRWDAVAGITRRKIIPGDSRTANASGGSGAVSRSVCFTDGLPTIRFGLDTEYRSPNALAVSRL